MHLDRICSTWKFWASFQLVWEEQALFHAKVCFLAYCILLWEGTLPGQSSSTIHSTLCLLPSGSAFPALDFSALGSSLAGLSQLWYSLRGRYCLQQFILPVWCCYLWWHNHGIYFAFPVSTVFPGFCCDFSWFRLSSSFQFRLPPHGFPLSMLCLESKCPSCPKSAR